VYRASLYVLLSDTTKTVTLVRATDTTNKNFHSAQLFLSRMRTNIGAAPAAAGSRNAASGLAARFMRSRAGQLNQKVLGVTLQLLRTRAAAVHPVGVVDCRRSVPVSASEPQALHMAAAAAARAPSLTPSRGALPSSPQSIAHRLVKDLHDAVAGGPHTSDGTLLCVATRMLWKLCGEQAGLCLRSDAVPRALVAVSQWPVLTTRHVQAFWHVASAVRRLAISEATGAAIARWSARWADGTSGSAIICACSRVLRGASDSPKEVQEYLQRPVAGLLGALLFHSRGRCVGSKALLSSRYDPVSL
jgi:hypothetical protein